MSYERVTPTWPGGRSQFEMDLVDPRPRRVGIPQGGVALGDLGRYGAVEAKPLNKAGGSDNAAFKLDKLTDTSMTELTKYAPLATQMLQQLLADDPRTDYRVYQAKVKNLKETIRSLPPFLQPLFRQRLRVVEARLRAAKEQRKLQIEGEQATRTWRWFGWAGGGTAIVVGIAIGVLVLAGASTTASHRSYRNNPYRRAA